MEDQTTEIADLFLHRGWLIPIAIIIGLTLLVHFIVSRFYKRVYPRLEKTHLNWDSALLKALIRPLKVILWTLGLTFSIRLLAFHFEKDSLEKILDLSFPLKQQVLHFVFVMVLYEDHLY